MRVTEGASRRSPARAARTRSAHAGESHSFDAPRPHRGELVALTVLLGALFLLSILTYLQLGEDSFITFRYVRNWVDGKGLVYNVGERVEGYSNLLWVLILAPFEALGLEQHFWSRILSTAFFGALVATGWWAARRVVDRQAPLWVVWWLPCALALEPLLHYHDDRGLETVPYVALLAGALFLVGARGSLWAAAALGALATLTRPEGVGFALSILPAVYLRAREDGKEPAWKPCLAYAALPLAAFVMQLLFRLAYYGEWLPNTMIMKRHGGGGGWVFILGLILTHALLPLVGLAGLLLGLRIDRTRALAAGGLSMMLATWAFQLRAGALLNEGFRYQITLLVPAVLGLWLLIHALAQTFEPRRYRSGALFVGAVAALLLVLLPVLIYSEGSRFLLGNGNAPRSRLHVRLFEKGTWNIAERWRAFRLGPTHLNADAGRWVRENLPADAFLAADQMGQLGFYVHKDQRVLDLLGLMDAHIARHGFSTGYLLQRAPQYLVVETCMDTTYWPRDWRLQPHVPALRAAFQDPALQAEYRPRWFLVPRLPFAQLGFMVYVHREVDDGEAMETVPVGADVEEFERIWRVL